MTLACLGTEGMVAFIGDGGDECDTEWCQFSIGENSLHLKFQAMVWHYF